MCNAALTEDFYGLMATYLNLFFQQEYPISACMIQACLIQQRALGARQQLNDLKVMGTSTVLCLFA